MAIRKKLEDRIRRKEQEITRLEKELTEARAYIQGLQDSLKMLPKENGAEESGTTIRPGSLVGRARDALRERGKSMHVNELLDALGVDRKRRNSLAGQLAAYARRGETFVRTAPNTYGLLEWGVEAENGPETVAETPPSDFGAIN